MYIQCIALGKYFADLYTFALGFTWLDGCTFEILLIIFEGILLENMSYYLHHLWLILRQAQMVPEFISSFFMHKNRSFMVCIGFQKSRFDFGPLVLEKWWFVHFLIRQIYTSYERYSAELSWYGDLLFVFLCIEIGRLWFELGFRIQISILVLWFH